MSEETIDDIMDATYRALCEHGYAELTMQDIAAESTKSKGTLHYHFDGKRELLEAFLEHLIEQFEARTETVPGETPAERLHAFVDELLSSADDDSATAFRTAMLEIKAQSPYDEAYQERLAEFDRRLRDRIADFVADGVAAGEFHEDIDPEATGEFLVTVFHGAQTRAAAVDRSPERTKAYVHDYIDEALRADDGGNADVDVDEPTAASGQEGSR
ncbi:TetR/AcrR family transcriptional regulator [Halopiger xanaduensis]|uniref:Regulatory protein TetR n=1 Tax=Halopiger xanaduensis (strain DSM 18323 / JCM 14033 / SH-6) TaxID=797210 RepID=F8D633_HALXS|nr:TetR/AcrR family transcriptional regulator [Halopiger xanaduensis]AEH38893.1 regulatory protein TetR [Halopiger xanaduensis SH-6]